MKVILKHSLTISLLIILSFQVSLGQQGPTSIWYFGDWAGITWNTLQPNGYPSYADTNYFYSSEGSSVVCDMEGNVLFNVDQFGVNNKFKARMPNSDYSSPGGSLLMGWSSTQAVLSVPKPDDFDTYYIFTTDYGAGPDGLCYSRLDMTLDGGLGDIDTTEKNVQLLSPCTEKLIGIKHANGTDYWVIAHQWNNNAFVSYLVSNAGVDTIPVITNIGINHNDTIINSIGYMKASTQGDRIAVAIFDTAVIEIFDFNAITGELSNCISLQDSVDFLYGLEFSPSGQYLYSTGREPTYAFFTVQYDLYAGTAADIFASRTQIGNLYPKYALQLGLDNRIYGVHNFTNDEFLYSIPYPDLPAPACGFLDTAVILGPSIAQANTSVFGLPNIIANQFPKADFTYIERCHDSITHFEVVNTTGLTLVEWNFNYPSTDTSWLLITATDSADFVFPGPGIYPVMMTAYFDYYSDNSLQYVQILESPIVDLGPDTEICLGDSLVYDLSFNDSVAPNGSCDYNWEATVNGNTFYDSLATFTITQPGIYIASVIGDSACGATIDTIKVQYVDVGVDLGLDIIVNEGTIVVLQPSMSFVSYFWSTGDTTYSIQVSDSGLYVLTVTDFNACSGSDSIQVSFINGLNEIENKELILYPNPGTGDFTLIGNNIQNIQINSFTGELIKELNINNHSEVYFSLDHQPRGVYFVRINYDGRCITKILLLQ